MAEEFRIGIGGPLYRLERSTHLESLHRLVLAVIAATWFPLVVFSLAERRIGRPDDSLLRDLSIHVRLLVTLPLLLLAERVLDRGCRGTVARLFDEGFVAPAEEPSVRAILRSAERWRDSSLPEIVLFIAAVASGVASLLGILPPAGLMHGVVESGHSAVRMWYALVSLPLFQFVIWRALFRWALWVRVLAGIARLPLRLLPTHADRRGGIGFLKRPSMAFGALLLLGVSAALCGGFATQILLYGAHIDAFKPLFIAYVSLGTIIAFAPLCAFVPLLLRARRQGRREYGGLVTDYSRQLHERWLEGKPPPELLGNQDFQSLADLGDSYRENVEKMEVLLFSPRDVVLLFVISQIPALPILLSQLPPSELLRLVRLFTGGMPG